jgi:MarR family transcriptional regulator, organic hydroperoxide resistance regulator
MDRNSKRIGKAAGSPGAGDANGVEPSLPLARSLGYHLRTLTETWSILLQRRLGPLGGTFPQWRYLRELWEEDGLSQRELSDRVGRQAATTVTALRMLKRSGLIRIGPAKEDRRKRLVFLTKKGRELNEALTPLIIEIENSVLAAVGDEDLARFKRTLARMQDNIDAEILNQNRTARARLWQFMKQTRAPQAESPAKDIGTAKRRSAGRG